MLPSTKADLQLRIPTMAIFILGVLVSFVGVFNLPNWIRQIIGVIRSIIMLAIGTGVMFLATKDMKHGQYVRRKKE